MNASSEVTPTPFNVYPSSGPTVLYLTSHTEDHSNNCNDAVSEQCSLMPCYSFAELAGLLTSNTEFIAIHIDFIEQSGVSIAEWAHMFSTITHVVKFKVPLTKRIIIKKTTSVETIAQLKKTTTSGILLDLEDFDAESVAYSLTQMLNRKPYWPKRIIDNLPGADKSKNANAMALTARQQQVLQLVCQRGSSNKAIAKILNISENTVKVHMSAIMGIYGVRSRTQLAIFTKSCVGDSCSTCTKHNP